MALKDIKFVLLLLSLLIISCANNPNEEEYSYPLRLRRLFKNTPAWELAKAVDFGETDRISELLKKNPSLASYQEQKHGWTVLMLPIYNQNRTSFPMSILYQDFNWGSPNRRQWASFCCLLEHGALVNYTNKNGNTPLSMACYGTTVHIEFVKKLLDYGADPNYPIDLNSIPPDRDGNSALQNAIYSNRDDLVKLLVSSGADVNYKNKEGRTALGMTLNPVQYDIAYYLLEHGADINMPVSQVCLHYYNHCEDSTDLYIAEELRYQMVELNSNQHKKKMKIVKLLLQKGIDYRRTPIPNKIIKDAKKEYPDTWEDYLSKY